MCKIIYQKKQFQNPTFKGRIRESILQAEEATDQHGHAIPNEAPSSPHPTQPHIDRVGQVIINSTFYPEHQCNSYTE